MGACSHDPPQRSQRRWSLQCHPMSAAATRTAARLMRSDPFITLSDAAHATATTHSALRSELLAAATRRCLPSPAKLSESADPTIAIPPSIIPELAPSAVRAVGEAAAQTSQMAAAATVGVAAWGYRSQPPPDPLIPAAKLRRWAIASPQETVDDPLCPHSVLLGLCNQLSRDHDPDVAYGTAGHVLDTAARNPACPPVVLVGVVGIAHASFVVEHRNCPPSLLTAMARSTEAHVREHAARARSLPHAAACRLVEDPDEEVRAALGFAVRCPDLLTRLAADTNIVVRCGVAANPDTPPTVVAELARRDEGDAMMANALELNPGWPPL